MENPYRLVDDVDGIGFKKADELASKIGIAVDSQWRIQSGIKYVLNEASFEGHSYLPIQVLADRTYVLLGVAQSLIETEIQNLIVDRKIVMRKEDEETCVYSTRMYYDEVVCARLLHELNLKSEETDRTHIMRRLDDVEKELDISLDELQREAVCLAIENNVMILTGGPGTGKTTTINTLIRYFDDEGLDFMLAAPTGRAAKRMTETTGYEARTIHRLLELSGNPELGGVRFERNEDNPLETDLVIIDEMSMVDIDMFAALLKAVPIGARLILVGDVDQLPSVGPGRVLQDLIASEKLATCQLERIFRQESRSDIVLNAHKIKAGERILLDNKSKDFFFLERSDTNVIYKHMVTLIKDKLPGYVDATPMQIQVLTPTRIGNLGTVALNKVLQMHLNPPAGNKKEVTYGDTVFREGDKVMQTKNNYTLEWKVLSSYGISADRGTGVFNGDIGVIKEVRTPLSQMVIEFDDGRRVEYPFASLDELELAYAVTIHKSQGSEYPAVVMPLLGGPRMLLNRNLLYTGITRARKCVTILGSRETVGIMIDNKDENMRYSGLASMIRQVEA
jgi:exodeoxyribonuclease V alpha subunit